jgi:hypothetical protein
MSVAYVFVCPRCLAPSASEQDRDENYCGRCHAVTAGPVELAVMTAGDYYRWTRACQSYGVLPRRVRRLGRHPSAQRELLDTMDDYLARQVQVAPDRPDGSVLTPAVLLLSGAWQFVEVDTAEGTATYRWRPLEAAEAGVVTWVPDASLGPFSAAYRRAGELVLTVRAEVLYRAAAELGLGPPWLAEPGMALGWLLGRRDDLAARELPAGPHGRLPPLEAQSGCYRCPSCAAEFEVPPGHPEPVMCGRHDPPAVMSRWMPELMYSPTGLAELAAEQYRVGTERYLELRQAGLSSRDARQLADAWPSMPDASATAWAALTEEIRGVYGLASTDDGVIMGEAIQYLQELTAAGSVTLDDAQAAELYRQVTGLDPTGNQLLPGLAQEMTTEQADALVREIRERSSEYPAWVTDAIAVWDGCKDDVRRRRSVAELAQALADMEPQYAPNEHGVDGGLGGTAATWSPSDPGDVIL